MVDSVLNIFLELFHLLTNPVWYSHSPLILQMSKLRPENLPKLMNSRAHKSYYVSKSQRL